MRIPNIYLGKYHKSYNKTNKVKRTITQQKPYIHKQQKQEAAIVQETLAYLKKQKELERETAENLNKALENIKVQEIQYNALLLYGIRLEKEKIIEILKARKAK